MDGGFPREVEGREEEGADVRLGRFGSWYDSIGRGSTKLTTLRLSKSGPKTRAMRPRR
jgi:hypothetical protein